MSNAALTGLRDYLFSTLNTGNLYWLATELTEYAKKKEAQHLKPYTMEELNARIDKAERDSAEGRYRDFDDFMRELEEKFAEEDRKELAMMEAV